MSLELNKIKVIACGTCGWGIGTYTYKNEDGKDDTGYGFPWSGMNPNDFYPDSECCSDEEIASWEKAKQDWK